MKQIDVKFDDAAVRKLKSMIGKELLSYKITSTPIPTIVHGAFTVDFGNKAYEFTNFIEAADHYGRWEDVAFFKLKDCNYGEVRSLFMNEDVLTVPINKTIREIDIVNENQRLFHNGIQTYNVWVTRGIIFRFDDGSELSLEKDIWFSENIFMEQGFDLIDKFESTDEFVEEWDVEEFRGECFREIETITLDSEMKEQLPQLPERRLRIAHI